MVQKCPVCGGRGQVPLSFYDGGLSNTTADVQCRSCHGTGLVYDCSQALEIIPQIPLPPKDPGPWPGPWQCDIPPQITCQSVTRSDAEWDELVADFWRHHSRENTCVIRDCFVNGEPV